MRRVSLSLFFGFLMAVLITGAIAQDFTIPYHVHIDIYALGGSLANPPIDNEGTSFTLVDEEDGGPTALSLAGGSITGLPLPGAAWGSAEIAADPDAGSIAARVHAAHSGPAAEPHCVYVPFLGKEICQAFSRWGSASAYGYISRLVRVESPDGSLNIGDPVDLEAGISIEGSLPSGDYHSSGVQAGLLLTRIVDLSIFDFFVYKSWGTFEDFFGDPTLHEQQGDPLGGFVYYRLNSATDYIDVDYDYSKDARVHVGDLILMEVGASVFTSLYNDGVTRESWAEFDNTIQSSLTTDTPGAALVPFAGEVSPTLANDHISPIAQNVVWDDAQKIFSFDLALTNTGSEPLFPPIRTVVAILDPPPPTITLNNPDGGGNGIGGYWDYSNTIGSDGILSPGETTEFKRWEFYDPDAVNFTCWADVYAVLGPSLPKTAGSGENKALPMAAYPADNRLDIGTRTMVKVLPESFALYENYPNPFNPETTIKYQLPEASEVSLSLFSLLGQEIRTLVNEEKEAGYHTIVWDGKDNSGKQVASGVYIYRIKAGEFVDIKKLTLLR